MLLDNKTSIAGRKYFKVFDYLKAYAGENGTMNIVTGYFTINALSEIYDKLCKKNVKDEQEDGNIQCKFRLLLGYLIAKYDKKDKIIDLLREDLDIDKTLRLSSYAKKAIKFLEQDAVQIKHISDSFCHAKAFIYEEDDSRHKFYIVGSSNLTEAGLGIQRSSNIELNIAI